ncbi:hypothetical protein Godav_027254, partial [Gossypium davidsonii]|nr:hypothetical protein [Gossypium davidsonii]
LLEARLGWKLVGDTSHYQLVISGELTRISRALKQEDDASKELKLYVPKGRHFRFLTGWVEHTDFSEFVKEKWSFNGDTFPGTFKGPNELDSSFGLFSNIDCLPRRKWFAGAEVIIRLVGFVVMFPKMLSIFNRIGAWEMWTVNVFLGLLRGAFGRIAISSFFKGLPKMLMKLSMCHSVGQDNLSLLIGAHQLCHKEMPSNGSNSALIRRIHQLLTRMGHKHIRHISREDNQDADRLVKLAQHRTYDLYLY